MWLGGLLRFQLTLRESRKHAGFLLIAIPYKVHTLTAELEILLFRNIFF